MNNIALGKYLPLDSIIHHMDPRAKIGAMLIMMIAIFIPAGYAGYGVIAAAVIGTALLARLKLSFLWRAMKPMLFMLTFLLIINLLVIRDGDVLFTIFGFSVYTGAIAQTLYIVVRLALMIMITTILTATTKPLELTLGIEDLLKPFQVIHVPAHEIAMMISIALRFIPTLIEETQRIMKAQASRIGKYSSRLKVMTFWKESPSSLCILTNSALPSLLRNRENQSLRQKLTVLCLLRARDRKSTRLNSSHSAKSRMPSSA